MSKLTSRQHEVLAKWAVNKIAQLGGPTNFQAAIDEKVKKGKPYSDAVTEAAKERPDLYQQYRLSSYTNSRSL